MIELESLESKEHLVNLWLHETFRVFRDRLVDEKDRGKFSVIVHETMENYLYMEWKLETF
jgi:dynein heavy chain